MNAKNSIATVLKSITLCFKSDNPYKVVRPTAFELIMNSYKTLEISRKGGVKMNPQEIIDDPKFKDKIDALRKIIK
ncbi:hypothetical protein KPA96_13610 [Burkholderia cenocepacia]|uniref:hypothetical protein n=1 Tax=Burkholderia cenocepacia TaxID=95486 RepID=UPI002855014F|nr:hypothetical protein [Burkholderia cenocepacia]MCB4346787.1 hypothetical protein [Burkholderia vietnamiensis]MDR8076693.1 hypothetical protein [Burkholderia cenocepacia]